MPVREIGGGSAVIQAHRKLSDLLRRRAFPPGSRLPGERELAGRIGVSRSTLRKALDQLEDEGHLDRSPQRGWFVPPQVVGEPPSTLQSFSEMARSRGLTPGARILGQLERAATFEESSRLRIAPGAPVLELTRLRTLDDLAVCVDVSIIVLARVPRLAQADMTDRSLYETIEELSDVRIARSSYTLRADASSQPLAELLEIPPGSPVLVGEELTYGTDGAPVLTATLSYRADAYRFEADLFRMP
jgi:GntR family transcriptional regulator